MAIMTDRQSVAANTTISTVCSGKIAEFVHEPSAVRLFGSASAVGLNMSLIIGEEVVVEDQEVNAQNRMPIIPDDFVAEGRVPGGPHCAQVPEHYGRRYHRFFSGRCRARLTEARLVCL